MTSGWFFGIAFVVLLSELPHLCMGQTRAPRVSDNTLCKSACRPWDPKAPLCQRKLGMMEARWGLTLPRPVVRGDVNVSYLTYAFCPTVDEIQAFLLNYSTAHIALNRVVNETTGEDYYEYTPTESYLWMWGAGPENNREFPGIGNDTAVMVYDGLSQTCNYAPAIVSMLIYNVTLVSGKYQYENGMASGTGFMPTCTEEGICKMDATLKCIGPVGRQNCAKCLNENQPREVLNKDLVIFTTYYGTDSRDKTLMSGSGNPLNFRMFSGGSAYQSVAIDASSFSETFSNANPFSDVDSFNVYRVPNVALNGDNGGSTQKP